MVEIENEIIKSFNLQLKDRENSARENIEKNKKSISMIAVERKVKQKELGALKKSIENVLKSICDFVDEVTNDSVSSSEAEPENNKVNTGSENSYAFL